MEFKITRANGEEFTHKNSFKKERDTFIKIESLEELLSLIKEVNCALILHDDSITVYDDYVE